MGGAPPLPHNFAPQGSKNPRFFEVFDPEDQGVKIRGFPGRPPEAAQEDPLMVLEEEAMAAPIAEDVGSSIDSPNPGKSMLWDPACSVRDIDMDLEGHTL